MERIAHIVPTVPPEFNGLGDYCYQLWKHWPEPKPEWHVLATRIPEGAHKHWPEARLIEFQCNAESLLSSLRDSGAQQVVLHYVGYGYSRKGIPLWLPQTLAKWKQASSNKLVVIFHELFATGPMWSSAFWTSTLQRRIAKNLVQAADRWTTSCLNYYEILTEKLGADPQIGATIPIGSNIDLASPAEYSERWPLTQNNQLNIAVFGTQSRRTKSLHQNQRLLRHLFDQDLVSSLSIIGNSNGCNQDELTVSELNLPRERCKYHYNLAPDSISNLLKDSHIGLLSTPPSLIHKSGVYAAYTTHGVVSITPGQSNSSDQRFVTNDERTFQALLDRMKTIYETRTSSESMQFSFASVSQRLQGVLLQA